MPQGDTVFATRTVVVSLLVGTVVTLLAGIVPAIRATRVPPIAAVREGATPRRAAGPRGAPPRSPWRPSPWRARSWRSACSATAPPPSACWCSAAASLLLFIGVAMISSRLVRPIAALVGWPVARLGASGRLARQNAVRNPARTAATAAALMVGLALVTFVTRPRHRPARHDREGRGAAGRRGLRRHLHQRLGPAPAGRRAGARPPRPRRRRSAASARTRRSSRARSRTWAASTRPRSARSTASTGPRARTRRSPRWTATARSSSGRSPMTTTWRSARRSSS